MDKLQRASVVSFTVMGAATGKGRAKHRNVPLGNGKMFTKEYTPEKTRNYEQLVRLEYERQAGSVMFAREDALAMSVVVFKAIPKGTSKIKTRRMLAGEILPGKKPDVSNIIKAIEDGLNKVAYPDDNQIVDQHGEAYYGEVPRVEVTIRVKGIKG